MEFEERLGVGTQRWVTLKHFTAVLREYAHDEPAIDWHVICKIAKARVFQREDISDDKVRRLLEQEMRELTECPSTAAPSMTHLPVSLVQIDHMSGEQFERFVADLFGAHGVDAEVTRRSGDQGADVIVKGKTRKAVCQCKRWLPIHSVGNDAIQQAVAAVKHYDCDEAWVITTSFFRPSARSLAGSNGAILLDRSAVSVWLSNQTAVDSLLDRLG